MFSGEMEVHSGKTVPQGHRGKSVIGEGKTLTSSWPRFQLDFPKARTGLREVLDCRAVIRAAMFKL